MKFHIQRHKGKKSVDIFFISGGHCVGHIVGMIAEDKTVEN